MCVCVCVCKAMITCVYICWAGWSFFLCIVGTLLTFLCALLSVQADSATSSHKVEEEVLAGNNLICLL